MEGRDETSRDLHNEHVNKLFKEILTNMGANLTAEAMQRAARSITACYSVADILHRMEYELLSLEPQHNRERVQCTASWRLNSMLLPSKVKSP